MDTQQSAVIKGKAVVPGVAFGPIAVVAPRPAVPEMGAEVDEGHREAEYKRFESAADAVVSALKNRAMSLVGNAADVVNATAGLAADRGWRRKVKKLTTQGRNAIDATVSATASFVDMFTANGGVFAERVADLEDVRDRVLAQLQGIPEPGLPTLTSPSILLADDLAPADTATLNPELVLGIVTRCGGPTSHTAIIARQLNIPCVVAVGTSPVNIESERTPGLINGAAGELTIRPDETAAASAVHEWSQLAEKIAHWEGPAQTKDGHRVQLLANVQDGPQAASAASTAVEGVGLFRTELLFLSSTKEPTVDDQAAAYSRVLNAFPTGKVVVRTLDAGSDKPVPFVEADKEDNPALGVRGVRIAWDRQDILSRQLDAIAQAVASSNHVNAPTWVMAPMIATVDEARWFADMCRERSLTPGVMVEVPAVAMCASEIMREVDFVSIGTNDLTQYTMAADRLSSPLAHLNDPWQPAVLRLIKIVCSAGVETGTPVGVCGEAASDPLLACVLTGLGVNSLSVAAPSAAGVGAQIGDLTFEECQAMAAAALAATSAADAKAAAAKAL
ncbi:phosphoenolpyruvate--protein phosphotransferase [Corynebacterium kroppenstedtii]|uniref:phosphoenolpyruvate--protein phosphotransferase n=1 Tax=Corynebacterium sp. PCR 32 TaxID=3351342 RepID=UPI0030B14DF6